MAYGKACNNKYKEVMQKLFDFMEDAGKRLQRPVKDLDDIRFVMGALKDIRGQEVHVDMRLPEVEVRMELYYPTIFWSSV